MCIPYHSGDYHSNSTNFIQLKYVSVSNTNSQPQYLSCSISVTNRDGSVDSVACVMPTNWIMIVMCTVFSKAQWSTPLCSK